MDTTIQEIKERIKQAIAKRKVGVDHINPVYMEGLSAGLYFWKLLEKVPGGTSMNFVKQNENLARQLGLSLAEIDLTNIEIIPPDPD